ncbi:hypothetical protein [Pontibacter liquoris]|uniref:hypothetical protein n=1 Tax=Pontibacter liquoris TaxID=2905677 RepID=UPI001FA7955E|nr:hypothetical protein [Pontibacter liquoris]
MQHAKPLSRIVALFTCVFLLSVTGVLAQGKDKLTLKPTEGKLPASVKKQAYYYPAFKSGQVRFVNGVSTSSLLNYNRLNREVEFIDAKKDTLALADMQFVQTITFETDTFYYNPKDKALLKLVASYAGGNKLLVQEKYDLTNIKNVGALGMEYSTTSPTSSSSNQVLGDTQNRLKQNETMVYSLKNDYYFTDNAGRFVPASKAGALKLAPQQKEKIKAYLQEKKPDFNSEADLRTFLAFVAGL